MLLCNTSTALAGDSAVLLAGIEGLLPAIEAGMQRIGSVEAQRDEIAASLDRLAEPLVDGDPPSELGAAAPLLKASSGGGARLWSDLLGGLAARAREAAARAVAVMASAADAYLRGSRGRLDGEPVGRPGTPSVILGSPGTAALFARDTALVSGDRVAALSSQDTASVAGGALAQLKSPQRVEVAGGEEARWTSAGVADMAARSVRIAGGYFPGRAAPRLRPTTSVGVMSRRELQVMSTEDCVLICADKNVIITAHTGSLKLLAKQQAAISAGSVSVSSGPIRVTSRASIDVYADGNVTVEAAGDVQVKAAGAVKVEAGGDVDVKAAGTVKVEAASVEVSGPATMHGPVTVLGDLTVAGTINGKRL